MNTKKKPNKMKKIYVLGIIIALGTAIAVSAANNQEALTATEPPLPEWGDNKEIPITPLDVMFDHDSHVVKHRLSCFACHPHLFAQEHGAAASSDDYNKAAFAQGKSCGACHNDDVAFGVVEANTCIKCHGSDMIEPETIVFTKPVKAVYFDHLAHTRDFGLACIDCHGQLFRADIGYAEQRPERFVMEAMYRGMYCGACHDGEQAFASNTNCMACHIGVRGYEELSGENAK